MSDINVTHIFHKNAKENFDAQEPAKDELINDMLGDAVLGVEAGLKAATPQQLMATSLVLEAATESRNLCDLIASGVPLDLNDINYKDKLTARQQQLFTECAIRLYSDVVEYLRSLDVVNFK